MTKHQSVQSLQSVMGVRAIRILRMEEAATGRMKTFLFSRRVEKIHLNRKSRGLVGV